VVLGALLAAYLVAVLQPLRHRAAARDKELVALWGRLAATNSVHPVAAGLSLDQLEARLRGLRPAGTNLEVVARLARARIELPREVDEQMRQPFQLIDYQNERLRWITLLSRRAKEQGVSLEAPATDGLPEYLADMDRPTLLWPRLHMAGQLLLSAIHAKTTAVRALAQMPLTDHGSGLRELPMRLEVVGSMETLSRLLVALPSRGAELKVAGLAEVLTNKPAFFVDQLLLRKNSPERPQEVQMELTVSGFVAGRDEPYAPSSSMP
jgi:hypothetical protein